MLDKQSEPDIWFGTSGPKDAEIVLVGEAWGYEESLAQQPFIGASGNELSKILAEAGIPRSSCLITNVVPARPQSNEVWRLFHPKMSNEPRYGGLSPRQDVVDGVRALHAQIQSHPRRLVIAFGNYALWALSNHTGSEVIRASNGRLIPKEEQPYGPTGITSWRGSMVYTIRDRFAAPTEVTQTPLLPILHPASILRAWDTRQVTIHDLRARVKMALRGDWRPQQPPIFWAPPTYTQVVNRLELWHSTLERGPLRLVCDIETSKGLITCLGLSDSPNFAMSIPFVSRSDTTVFDSWYDCGQEATIVRLLRKLFQHPALILEGQNFIYDTQYIQKWLGVTPRLTFDTMLAQNVLFPGTPKTLDYLSSLYCRYHWYWKEDHKEWNLSGTLEDLLRYNCLDCVRTFECATTQRTLIEQMDQQDQFRLKMRVNDLCLRMMDRGVRIDRNRAAAMSIELHESLNDIYSSLLRIVPQESVAPDAKTMWYKSSQQTATYFYEMLGMEVVHHHKTKQPTVGKEALEVLKRKYPWFSGIFNRLDSAGSAANTAAVLKMQLDHDGRARCSFNPGGTETHRLSSAKNAFNGGTNLQNLTKGDEDHRGLSLPNVRKIFVPDPGYTMFDADLSGADAQVVAWEAEDDDLKAAFRAGLDVHSKNAEDMWGPSFTRLQGEERRAKRQELKVAVHMTNYGGTPRTLAISQGWTVHDAEKFQRRWFSIHPNIRNNFHNKTRAALESNRTIHNAFGFRRVYFDRIDSCLPEALAWIPQSTVAINSFLGAFALETHYPLCEILLNNHDSNVFQFPDRSLPSPAEILDALRVATPYPDPLYIPWSLHSSDKSWGDCS